MKTSGKKTYPMRGAEEENVILVGGLTQCVFCPTKVCLHLPGYVQKT